MATELTPKQILDMVLDKSSFGDPEKFHQRFSAYLIQNFDTEIFFSAVNANFNHSYVVIQGNIAKSIVYDERKDPCIAYLIKEESGWKLHSINWMCFICNGRGIIFNGSDIPNLCVACGGAGWGLLGDFEFSVAETADIEIEE